MNTGPSPLATAACWAFVPISCFSALAFELAATGVPKVRVFAGLEGRRGFAGRRRPTGWGEAWGRKDSDGSLRACGRRAALRAPRGSPSRCHPPRCSCPPAGLHVPGRAGPICGRGLRAPLPQSPAHLKIMDRMSYGVSTMPSTMLKTSSLPAFLVESSPQTTRAHCDPLYDGEVGPQLAKSFG